jgi:hypothetical protein
MCLESVPQFNTASVTNMLGMFSNCRSIVEVVDSTFAADRIGLFPVFPILFDISSVTNMANMFSGCSSLKTIVFTTSAGAGTTTNKFSNIFGSCPNLSRCKLPLAEYSLSLASCNMSKATLEGNCYSFEGSSGSVYECNKDNYGTNMYGGSVLNKMIDSAGKNDVTIEILPEDTNWLEINYD